MKKIALIAFSLLLIACQENQDKYSISADTEGFEDGTIVYINAIDAQAKPKKVDSVTIQQGKFQIDLPTPELNDFNYLTFNTVRGNVLFLAENSPFTMTIYKDSLRASIVNAGPENKLFFDYIKKIRHFGLEKSKLSNRYYEAKKSENNDEITEIGEKRKQLFEDEKTYRINTAKENPNSIVSIIAITDLINFKTLTAKEGKELFDNVGQTIKDSRIGKNLEGMINNGIALASRRKVDIGSTAEDFSAPTPEGKTLSLKESLGKVTIVDFWASWCKPCRIENPNVVRVYNKYHDKGLNIIGVSLDKKKESWVKAIEDDNLTWGHVSNLKFWQEPIAQAYGVRSIPATFILDEKGNVIAKNLRGPALEEKIAELLD